VGDQLGLFGATGTGDYWAILDRQRERQGIVPPHHDWYPGAPRVGSMPEHTAEYLADRFAAFLGSIPERLEHLRQERAREQRRQRVHGSPVVLRGAGHALRWWTSDKRIVTDLRAVTRRRLLASLREDASYDRHAQCVGRRWGLGGALRRYTPWLCDDVWAALPQLLRGAVMRATKRLPPCVGELMHPVAIWWNLAPTHALRRLGLGAQ